MRRGGTRRPRRRGPPRRDRPVGHACRRPQHGDIPVRTRGIGVVELLVATALGMLAMTALTAAVATGARLLVAAGARGEAEDTAQLAVEAFVFDVRRAGYDPQAARVHAPRLARPHRLP